ncbi:lysophospholipid acyltransferase family protein [Crocosphaera sp.]|uniref:lysophospholipid acyltransferase family protein n=1 Tax=Crocosphaera sp. TaxID=2729996 RepID=UPI00262AD0E6|nr:lysophospholipid acyltransferase family protein [Crocosphaera sp.]MDJ0583101.1 lysophospholipid acyltransferase family protein [Crocosphaera sp.]
MNIPTSKSEQVKSRISPWLINIAYPFGSKIVLPFYFGSITINGQENIPKTDPVIIAPTHRSRWDALIVPYAFGRIVSGRDVRFMVTSSEMTGIQGWFIRRMGGFPVDIKRPGASSLEYSVEVLKQGEMLVIFPEGGIFRDTEVHPLKRGVARIALEVESQQPGCGMKILPVRIEYSQPFPSWGTDITVNISPPLDVATYDTTTMKRSSQKLTHDLESNLKRIFQGKLKQTVIQK